MRDSLARAREARLFEGRSIFVTAKTVPKPADLGQIISANGGAVCK
jgi:hypothetical protein